MNTAPAREVRQHASSARSARSAMRHTALSLPTRRGRRQPAHSRRSARSARKSLFQPWDTPIRRKQPHPPAQKEVTSSIHVRSAGTARRMKSSSRCPTCTHGGRLRTARPTARLASAVDASTGGRFPVRFIKSHWTAKASPPARCAAGWAISRCSPARTSCSPP